MAQAGAQRLLVQICDALEELLEGVAQDREARQYSEEEDEEEDPFDDEKFEEDLADEPSEVSNSPVPSASPFLHPVLKEDPVTVVPARGSVAEDSGDEDDGGGRAA